MKIDKETLHKLAHLARIEIDPEKEEMLLKDLEQILEWMEKLKEVDTSDIKDVPHMSSEINTFREDVAANKLTRDQALKNAPDHNGEFFKVPKVLG